MYKMSLFTICPTKSLLYADELSVRHSNVRVNLRENSVRETVHAKTVQV